ncbi:Protein phosphatase 2C homolog 2 [Sparassis crispa]|uniref:protein-serine/threonine phosphatase n=1 Tax=Sparassis crispa TaxID=139825 RepID=A0A401H5Q7_9APHY|nr:Protein phosphatase 2C homolog 2 [Sparassis crispa]GBE89731.1 Protein phosphatase 2C homolog 2 [Sparassis crispa]
MGNYLSIPVTTKFTTHDGNDKFAYAVCATQGWRTVMEDTHITQLNLDQRDETNALFAVFDGHSDIAPSKFASENLHKILVAGTEYTEKAYPKALKKAFLETDAQLSKFVGNFGGCTATVSLITPEGTIYVANAGDSRAVLSVKGEAKPLSVDHKPNVETEKARITGAGGFVERNRVNGEIAMSRALGDFRLKKNSELPPEKQAVTSDPEITQHQLSGEDEFLVLACDGIWDCVSSQDVVNMVRLFLSQGMTLPKVCEEICNHCIAPNADGAFGNDNMTIVIVALLQGRTTEEWYKWITERTTSRYGYETPEKPPQLYSPTALKYFKEKMEVYEEGKRKRKELKARKLQAEDGAGVPVVDKAVDEVGDQDHQVIQSQGDDSREAGGFQTKPQFDETQPSGGSENVAEVASAQTG